INERPVALGICDLKYRILASPHSIICRTHIEDVFTLDFTGNHIISVSQFDRPAADRVFEVADGMQPYAMRKRITRVLQGAILSNMFFE
ncbi:MAG TPA: hypothetical protein DCP57_03590, partial [Gammaproteobacteria bacterium]|nr:hypothetical protein [Gammaproteobacteria bacterium]